MTAALVLAGCLPIGNSGAVDGTGVPAAPWASVETMPVVGHMPDGASIGASPAPWLRFCDADPERNRCRSPEATAALTKQRWEELVAVQALVHAQVRQVPDDAKTGDTWELAEAYGAGDCEDIALTKRDLLIQLGWPAGALRPAMCYEPSQTVGGEALHTVLTVETDSGTFVLGNLAAAVRPWDNSECAAWVMRAGTPHWRWIAGGARAPIRPVTYAQHR